METIVGVNNSFKIFNFCFIIPMFRQLALFKNVFYPFIYCEPRHFNTRIDDIRQFGTFFQIKSQVWLKIWEFVSNQTTS